MVEMMFGTATPVWTAMPPVGSPYQTAGLGTRSIATPVFNAPAISGSFPPSAQPGLTVPGVAATYPFATYAFAPALADASGAITVASLLAGVAMRRGQPQGPTTDSEIEDFFYDTLDLLPGAADVEVRCENGRAILTGTVQHKRTKRDIGEIAWAIPAVQDVQNNVTITSRRRARSSASREGEASGSTPARKQA